MLPSVARAGLRPALLLLPFALFAGRAAAQEPPEVTYTQLEPKGPFQYKYKGADGKFVAAACTAGVFRWEVPRSEYGTGGLDREFTGYCAEVLVPIVADKTYRFRADSIYAPENYNLAGLKAEDKAKRGDAANRRARLVQELFARHFRDPVLKAVDPTDAVAFQVALWEVVQETEPAEGEMTLDLFAGDFQANYPRAEAPAYVARAQEYLSSLTGKEDAPAVANPDLRGRELIRLQGVANAEGVVAQSQFALRYPSGESAEGGARLTRDLGGQSAGGGGGALAGGAGAAGTGAAAGAGLPFGATGGATGGQGSPFQSPADLVRSTPPLGGPIESTTPFQPPADLVRPTQPFQQPFDPPRGEGPPAPSPVPAPAGAVLALLALGSLGAGRAAARLLAAR